VAVMPDAHAPTAAVLDRFAGLNRIPRPSRHEQRVLAWLSDWADGLGLQHDADATGNLRVCVPAAGDRRTATPLAIQGHVDMVCEKTPGSTHDFMRDPIRLVREGDWLRADGTTLGADNGIAVAIMMTLAETAGIDRPPLELLFTVDEETGLNGAAGLDPALLTARRLINLDSEEEGVFIVGCAGGRTIHGVLPAASAPAPGLAMLRVTLGGLRGGHSGVDIHLGRANAVHLLAEALSTVADYGIRLVALNGGSARNAIPRDAVAEIAAPPDRVEPIVEIIRKSAAEFRQRFSRTDPDLTLAVEPLAATASAALPTERTRAIFELLRTLPHGVLAMTPESDTLVETSTNLASVALRDGELTVIVSPRSVLVEPLAALSRRLQAIFCDAGAAAAEIECYPPWPPDFDSPLLARCKAIHAALFGVEPRVDLIHAGLECGVIGAKIPGIDMISCGPTIHDPHSPSERVHVPSIGRIGDFTVALLKAIDA
jgi:dipeptidase D